MVKVQNWKMFIKWNLHHFVSLLLDTEKTEENNNYLVEHQICYLQNDILIRLLSTNWLRKKEPARVWEKH